MSKDDDQGSDQGGTVRDDPEGPDTAAVPAAPSDQISAAERPDAVPGARSVPSQAGTAGPAGPVAKPEKARLGGVIGVVRETVIVVGTALALSLLIKTFLAQAFYIPSESMQDTLVRNDRVLVNLLEPGPLPLERGDVVVFKDPGGWLDPTVAPVRSPFAQRVVDVLTFVGVLPQDAGEHLIKRVVGMPGDTVVCCDDAGRLTVDGVALEETYLPPGTEASTIEFDVTVPEGRLWVLGDNRGFSQDSRYHQDLEGGGAVSEDLVVGRAVLLFWPLDRFGTLSNHPSVFEGVPGAG